MNDYCKRILAKELTNEICEKIYKLVEEDIKHFEDKDCCIKSVKSGCIEKEVEKIVERYF